MNMKHEDKPFSCKVRDVFPAHILLADVPDRLREKVRDMFAEARDIEISQLRVSKFGEKLFSAEGTVYFDVT